MKKAMDDLKGRPKEERTATAGAVAMAIMALLFIGWAFFFLQKLSRGVPVETEWGPRQDVIDFSNLRSAQESFSNVYFDATEELRKIRDEAASRQRDALQAEQNSGASGGNSFDFEDGSGSGFGQF